MQAYHANGAQPPYYPQPQYPQQPGYMNYTPYPAYAATLPPQMPFPSQPYPRFPTPPPRNRKMARTTSASAAVPTTPKSIMKNVYHRSASAGGVQLSRRRTPSDPRPRVNSQTRSRANSNAQFVPGSTFYSFSHASY